MIYKNSQNSADNFSSIVDEIDKKIVSALDSDAREPIGNIAKSLNISRQAVDYRLKNLKKRGVFFGDLVIFDTGVLGFNWYRVLIRLMNVSQAKKNEFLKYLSEHKRVTWLGEVGGRWDIAVNFACTDPMDFNNINEDISVKFGSLIKETDVLVYIDIFDYSRAYLNQENFKRNEFFHRMSRDNEFTVDKLDKSIIRAISKNACFDYSTLGKELKVSRNTVSQRIKRLIKRKLILGFRSFVDLQKIGYQSNMLFLQVNSLDRERETELYYYLKMLPEVTFIVKHIGKWKIGLEIETESSIDFQNILINLRSQFSDLISDYETFPLIKDHLINYFPEGVLENL